MTRVFSLRGALTLHKVDGALLFAVRAALAMALAALPMALSGRPALAVFPMLGAFTTTFGRNLPYSRRARVLALVALAMTACVGCGSALAALADPRAGGLGAAVVVAGTAVVAGLAKFACDATRLGGLGAVLLLFSFAVAASGAPAPSDVVTQTALAAMGAALAWALALLGWLVHPDRPQRLAVAAALRELADLLDECEDSDTAARPSRHRATAAILRAYHSLGMTPSTSARSGDEWRGVCVSLTDAAWSLLIGSAHGRTPDSGTAQCLRLQARLLTVRYRRPPLSLPGPPAGVSTTAVRRAAQLATGTRPDSPRHLAVPAVPALRMALGTGLAGGLAAMLGLGHGYWAAISAAAVLHSVNVRTTAHRALQRTLGTAAGLLISVAVLAMHPSSEALISLVVLFEFLLEYVVARNYGLGVVFLTPLALLMSDLASPSPAGTLVHDRLLGSVLGIAIGLACALLVVHDRAAVRVQRALAACTEAAARAERALAERGGPYPAAQAPLAAAVVELREADDAAAGELWSAGIDPAELAAAEERAYELLGLLLRRQRP